MIDEGEPVVEFEEPPQKELEDEPRGLERERLIPRKDAEFVLTLPDALLVGIIFPRMCYLSNTSKGSIAPFFQERPSVSPKK